MKNDEILNLNDEVKSLIEDDQLQKASTHECDHEHKDEKYVNVTPYMGGDFTGVTFRYVYGKAKLTGLPTSQAIKSRARYASLLALASFVRNPKSFKEVYHAFSVSLEEVPEIPLIGLIYGCVNCSKSVEAFASPFKLAVSVEAEEGDLRWFCPPAYKKHKKCYDRYHALLSKTKDKDKTRSNELMPAKPFSIHLRVTTYMEKERLKLLDLSEDIINHMNCIFNMSIEFALLVLGIGKATSRGFGRFWKEKDLQKNLPTCENITDTITNFVEAWKKLIEQLDKEGYLNINIARNRVSYENPISDILNGNVPHLGFLYKLAEKKTLCRDPYMKADAGNVNVKIEKIAEAVLKSTWKRIDGNSRSSGVPYHTWPLGLPRKSKIRCTCDISDSQNIYGYLLAPKSKQNFCENFCAGHKTPTRDLRRVSMLHLMPLKEGILILPLLSRDLEKYMKPNSKYKLYHVGGHFVYRKPCCNRHFVAVDFIFKNKVIKAPSGSVVGCGCGRDEGGIKVPGDVSAITRPKNEYEKALIAAILWVHRALSE